MIICICYSTPGTYSEIVGTSSCLACEIGKSQGASGSTVSSSYCLRAALDISALQMCEECLPGRYNPSQGQNICLECSPGRITAVSGRSACDPCPTGYWQPSFGRDVCLVCPNGTRTVGDGSSKCEPCPKGSYSAGDRGRCEPCDPGRFSAQLVR